ncbi:MAG: hypothetical protein EOM22_00190 [Gammaproteobacteria bacterium]|nr:hypothetical protein [Gammaproteobacteria bacterium]
MKVEQLVAEQIHSLPELRVELIRELGRQSEELALIRQVVRILEDVVKKFEMQFETMASEDRENFKRLHDHITADAGARSKIVTGVFVAGASGISTLGALVWGVWQVIDKLP